MDPDLQEHLGGPSWCVLAARSSSWRGVVCGTSTLSIPDGIRRGNSEVAGVRVKGLASLSPFLGAPGAGSTYRSCGVVGLTVVLNAVRVRVISAPGRRSLLSDGLSRC